MTQNKVTVATWPTAVEPVRQCHDKKKILGEPISWRSHHRLQRIHGPEDEEDFAPFDCIQYFIFIYIYFFISLSVMRRHLCLF